MATAVLCGPVTLSAAFVIGVAGSTHCLAMCGGLSAALSLRGPSASLSRLASGLLHQVGRILSYALAGALAGSFSGLLQSLMDVETMARSARVLAGLVLLAIALGVLTPLRPLVALERLGGKAWRHIATLARHLPAHPQARALLLGMLWGWLPCGIAYSMLLFASLSGSAVAGAALMTLFGLGTLPALLGASALGGSASALMQVRGLRYLTGSMLLLFGVLTMLAPFSPHMHH